MNDTWIQGSTCAGDHGYPVLVRLRDVIEVRKVDDDWCALSLEGRMDLVYVEEQLKVMKIKLEFLDKPTTGETV